MNQYKTSYILRDDGWLDVFIVGPEGVPVARLENPVSAGEDAEPFVREIMAQLRGTVDDRPEKSIVLATLDYVWFWVRRLWGRTHSSPIP